MSAPASSCLSLSGAQFPHLHTEAADLTERLCGSLSVPASLTFPLLGSELPSVLLKPRGCNAHSLAVQASSGRCRPAPEGSAQSCFPVPGPKPHRRPNCACLQCQTLSQVGSPYLKQGRGPPKYPLIREQAPGCWSDPGKDMSVCEPQSSCSASVSRHKTTKSL